MRMLVVIMTIMTPLKLMNFKILCLALPRHLSIRADPDTAMYQDGRGGARMDQTAIDGELLQLGPALSNSLFGSCCPEHD